MGAGVEVEEGEGGACMDRREDIHCPIPTGSTVDSPNNSTQNHFKGVTSFLFLYILCIIARDICI